MKNLLCKTFVSMAVASCTAVSACTSWVITPQASASGRMLVHKGRDYYYGTLVTADMRPSYTGWKVLRIGTRGAFQFAVNSHGVVAITNDGDATFSKFPREEMENSVSSHDIIAKITREITSARAGANLFKKVYDAGTYSNRNCFMAIADPREALVVEGGYNHFAASLITKPFHIYSNHWHVPGIDAVSSESVGYMRGSILRERRVRDALRQNSENGKFSVCSCFAASRVTAGTDPKLDVPVFRPCRGVGKVSSMGACTFELDPDFPDVLTTAYLALGPQQHTVYIPVPMAVDTLPEVMTSGKWSEYSYKLRDAVGDNYPQLKELIAFETAQCREYAACREEAKKLLRDGKRQEATDMMKSCFERQWRNTEKFLLTLGRPEK